MRRFLRKPITPNRLRRLGFTEHPFGYWRFQLPAETLGPRVYAESFLQLLPCGDGLWTAEMHVKIFDETRAALEKATDPTSYDSAVSFARKYRTIGDVCLLLESLGGPLRRESAGAVLQFEAVDEPRPLSGPRGKLLLS